MKHKKLFISLTAVLSVIVALMIFIMMWFFGDSYPDFSSFEKSVAIPGLKDGAAPQGLCNYSAEYTDGDGNTATQQYFFISAYMSEGASRIYVTGEDTGEVGYVTLNGTDGEPFSGHCGGIATNGTYLWAASDGYVYVAALSDSTYSGIAEEIIAKAGSEETESITFTASFNAQCGADFVYYYDDPSSTTGDRLYVGEFYRKGNYETDEKHHITTPSGELNTAFAYEYNVSATTPYGLVKLGSKYTDFSFDDDNNVPAIQKIISLPAKIQGFARADGKLVLSQSYGLANSHLYYFSWSSVTSSSNRINYKSAVDSNFIYYGVSTKNSLYDRFTVQDSLYIYYADCGDGDLLLRDYSIPCMSEGMCTYDGNFYVLFESASKKYRTFVREQLKNVYSFVPSEN